MVSVCKCGAELVQSKEPGWAVHMECLCWFGRDLDKVWGERPAEIFTCGTPSQQAGLSFMPVSQVFIPLSPSSQHWASALGQGTALPRSLRLRDLPGAFVPIAEGGHILLSLTQPLEAHWSLLLSPVKAQIQFQCRQHCQFSIAAARSYSFPAGYNSVMRHVLHCPLLLCCVCMQYKDWCPMSLLTAPT